MCNQTNTQYVLNGDNDRVELGGRVAGQSAVCRVC